MAPDPKKNILLIEQSPMFAHVLTRSIESIEGFKVFAVNSFNALQTLLAQQQHVFFASLLDPELADASHDKAIDCLLAAKIPTIIFTAKADDDFRSSVYSRGLVDYVLKEGPSNIEYVLELLCQLRRNSQLHALVVDDSASVRAYIKHLLVIYQFNVLEAQDGEAALNKVAQHDNISLVLTDFNMPNMDGVMLTQKLRRQYSRQQMTIIGLSSDANKQLSAHFLKLGGSDFISKPFFEEEFFCRINQNMELLEHIKQLKFLATRDYLTGLYNRRHFFEVGEGILARYQEKGLVFGVALLDIDYFKKVNDKHGHDAGDLVLRQLGRLLLESIDSDLQDHNIVARFGGEEFCFLFIARDPAQIKARLSSLRKRIETDDFILENGVKLSVTASIGLLTGQIETLQSGLTIADRALYQAKHNGRNQLVMLRSDDDLVGCTAE